MVGTRRRLTLAPGAISPDSGSRFSALLEEDEADREAEELAVGIAADVLAEDRAVSREDVRRPARSDAEVAHEFWEYVGFPTKALRF